MGINQLTLLLDGISEDLQAYERAAALLSAQHEMENAGSVFSAALDEYAQKHGFKSWAERCLYSSRIPEELQDLWRADQTARYRFITLQSAMQADAPGCNPEQIMTASIERERRAAHASGCIYMSGD